MEEDSPVRIIIGSRVTKEGINLAKAYNRYNRYKPLENDPYTIYQFCGCCDPEVIDIMNDLLTAKTTLDLIERAKAIIGDNPYLNGLIGLTIKYINKYIPNHPYEACYELEAKEIEDLCIEFLMAERKGEFEACKGYVTLYSFIYTYLGVPNNGYPYIVMQWLENEGLIEHGSGIRCAWLNCSTEGRELTHVEEMIEAMSYVD